MVLFSSKNKPHFLHNVKNEAYFCKLLPICQADIWFWGENKNRLKISEQLGFHLKKFGISQHACVA